MTDKRESLKGRYGDDDAFEMLYSLHGQKQFLKFAEFLFDTDKRVSRNAAWVLTKAIDDELIMVLPMMNKFIDLILTTENSSLRRLTLNIIERLPMKEEDLRADLLDFCLEHMISLDEPPGIQSLCMKVAHKICKFYPELMEELHRTIENMQMEYYSPAIKSVRKRILNNLL